MTQSYTPAQLAAMYGPALDQSKYKFSKLNLDKGNPNRDGGDMAVTPAQAQLSDALGAYGPKLIPQQSGFDSFMSTIIPIATSIGLGGAFAPVVAGLGTVGSAAATGAIQGATQAGLTGQNIIKGGLTGALSGGLTKGLTPGVAKLTGLGKTAAGALTGAGVGAVKGAITGQGAKLGALGGAANSLAGSFAQGQNPIIQALIKSGGAAVPALASGNTKGAGGSVIAGLGGSLVGSLFGNSGSGSQPTSTTSNTPPTGSTQPMMPDFSNYPSEDGTQYQGVDPSMFGGGGYDSGGDLPPVTVMGDPDTSGIQPGMFGDPTGSGSPYGTDNSWAKANDPGVGGLVSSTAGGLSGLLGKLFGSGGGGNTGQAIAGSGLGLLGAFLQQQSQKSAAATYANNAAYKPYGITTPNGTTSFANGKGVGTLSPANQGLSTALQNYSQQQLQKLGVAQPNAGGFSGVTPAMLGAYNQSNNFNQNFDNLSNSYNAAGQGFMKAAAPGNVASDYASRYGQLQQLDQGDQQKFFQNNLDDQQGKGILASTAGQYQTQGALDSLNRQNTANQVQAQNFALGDQAQNLQGASTAAGIGQNYSALTANDATSAFQRALGLFGSGQQANVNNQNINLSGLQTGLQGAQGINASLLAQLQLGGNMGGQQSGANGQAFNPQLNANSPSLLGQLSYGFGQNLANSNYMTPQRSTINSLD